MAIDPFSQQIIQMEPCLRESNNAIATIPIAHTYAKFGSHIGAGQEVLDGPMQAAIYTGFFNPPANSSESITTNCPSGNCTFPSDNGATFSSLSMCHSCLDISDTVIYNYTGHGGSNSTRTTAQQATLPSSGASILTSTMLASEVLKQNAYDWFAFEALMSRDGGFNNVFAVECSMTPCLKTYGANVTNSIYHEQKISSQNLEYAYYSGADVLFFSVATNETLRDGTWQACDPSGEQSSVNTVHVNTTDMSRFSMDHSEVGGLWYPPDCVWDMSESSARSMRAFLYELFHDNSLVTAYNSAEDAYGDLWLMNLYQGGNATIDTVNSYMDGLTWSISGTMRQNGNDSDPNLSTVKGKVQTMQTCVSVRWAWISLPAALLGLQVAFLAGMMTMTRTSAHWRRDWKSSSLPLLFHGFDQDMAKAREQFPQANDLGGKDGMYEAAKGMKVQLRKGDSRWQFVEAG